jgi:hypothetical protein
MKRNMMGEVQAEPDDDVTALFEEAHGNTESLESERAEWTDEEHMGGWNATVRNADGDEMVVRGFDSQEALQDYLTRHSITIV